MLPLMLKYEPRFDVEKDIKKIERALSEGWEKRENVTPFPTARPIDNPEGSVDLELMNKVRSIVTSDGFPIPYTVAVLVGDDVCFHFKASTDLVIVLCNRLCDFNIVSREYWEYVFEAGIDHAEIDGEA